MCEIDLQIDNFMIECSAKGLWVVKIINRKRSKECSSKKC